jgi:hypothetical protein
MKRKKKNPVNPSTANPATPNPYGSSAKETFNACGKLVRCLCSSYICFVAIFIPIFPAKAEKLKNKATTINKCV